MGLQIINKKEEVQIGQQSKIFEFLRFIKFNVVS